jgi:RNA polymerase sigma-70 factor, ECF subfamily
MSHYLSLSGQWQRRPGRRGALTTPRARLAEAAPAPDTVIEPTEPHARELLGQYIAGFENSDTAALEEALRTDAAIELVGTRTWFSGNVTCLRYLAHVIGSPGDWLMTATLANGQSAAAAYYRDDGGTYQALGVAVLTATSTGVARITVFPGGAALVARLGLSPTHRDAGNRAHYQAATADKISRSSIRTSVSP